MKPIRSLAVLLALVMTVLALSPAALGAAGACSCNAGTVKEYVYGTPTAHYINTLCAQCGTLLSQGYGGHSYNSSGVCTLCGAVKPCTHTSTATSYSALSAAQHTVTVTCTGCGAVTSTSTAAHSFSGRTCTACGYTKPCTHTSVSKRWVTNCSWITSCDDCGAQISYGTTHGPYTYGSWSYDSTDQHRRTYTCVYGDSGTFYEYGSHTAIQSCQPVDEAGHNTTTACADCSADLGDAVYGAHEDTDGDALCDSCGYLMSCFSVTVPAALTLAMSPTGEIYAQEGLAIVNHSTAPVVVTQVHIRAENGWTLVRYDADMAGEKVDAKRIGFSINGATTTQMGTEERLTLSEDWVIEVGEFLPLVCHGVAAPSAQPVNEQVLTIVFVLEWA